MRSRRRARASACSSLLKSELLTHTKRSYPIFVTIIGVELLTTISSKAAVSRKSLMGTHYVSPPWLVISLHIVMVLIVDNGEEADRLAYVNMLGIYSSM